MNRVVRHIQTGLKGLIRLSVFSVFLLASLALEGNPSDWEYHALTPRQKHILFQAYTYGKEHDLGYSLAAIAWQESFVGHDIVPINLQDPSAGLWHKNVYMAIRETRDVPVNGLQVNLMAKRLIDDTGFAASLAISDLKRWKMLRNGDWMDTWASYNAGNFYESKQGRRYAREISRKVRILKRTLTLELPYFSP